MRVYNRGVTFQEVPNKVSYFFEIAGCPVQCKFCHSKHLWDENNGVELTEEKFITILETEAKEYVDCILFMGGEWCKDSLVNYLGIAQKKGFETCLYTGLTNVPTEITSKLTYLKTGPFIPQRGGLDSPTTNQNFIEVSTGKNLNKLFQK